MVAMVVMAGTTRINNPSGDGSIHVMPAIFLANLVVKMLGSPHSYVCFPKNLFILGSQKSGLSRVELNVGQCRNHLPAAMRNRNGLGWWVRTIQDLCRAGATNAIIPRYEPVQKICACSWGCNVPENWVRICQNIILGKALKPTASSS